MAKQNQNIKALELPKVVTQMEETYRGLSVQNVAYVTVFLCALFAPVADYTLLRIIGFWILWEMGIYLYCRFRADDGLEYDTKTRVALIIIPSIASWWLTRTLIGKPVKLLA